MNLPENLETKSSDDSEVNKISEPIVSSQDEKKTPKYVPPKSEDETWLIKPGKKVVFHHGVKIDKTIPIGEETKKPKNKKPKNKKLPEYIESSNTFRQSNSEIHMRHLNQSASIDISRLPERYQQLLKK